MVLIGVFIAVFALSFFSTLMSMIFIIITKTIDFFTTVVLSCLEIIINLSASMTITDLALVAEQVVFLIINVTVTR